MFGIGAFGHEAFGEGLGRAQTTQPAISITTTPSAAVPHGSAYGKIMTGTSSVAMSWVHAITKPTLSLAVTVGQALGGKVINKKLKVKQRQQTDPFWENVVFLCGFENIGGFSTVDEGPLNLGSSSATIAGSGTGSVSTQFKFGSRSLHRGASNNSTFYFADGTYWPSGANIFTIESWVRFGTAPTSGLHTWLSKGDWGNGGTPDRGWTLGVNSGVLTFWRSTDGINWDTSVSAAWSPTVGTWYHVAVDYDGSKTRLFVDGTMVASATGYFELWDTGGGNSRLSLGTHIDGTNGAETVMTGEIDEVRITVGAARYDSDGGFIAPSAAFPRLDGTAGTQDSPSVTDQVATVVKAITKYGLTKLADSGYDPNWSDVKVLLRFEPADGLSTFIDEGPSQLAFTKNGNIGLATSPTPPIGKSVATFDGTGDFLTTPSISALSMSDTSDFTFEAVLMIDTAGRTNTILSKRNTTSAQEYSFYVSGQVLSGVVFSGGASVGNATGATTMALNTWYEVAFERQGTQLRVYLNGVVDGTATQTSTPTSNSATFNIGRELFNTGRDFKGVMKQVRVTRAARYGGASYTPTGLTSLWPANDVQATTVLKTYNPLINAAIAVSATVVRAITKIISYAADVVASISTIKTGGGGGTTTDLGIDANTTPTMSVVKAVSKTFLLAAAVSASIARTVAYIIAADVAVSLNVARAIGCLVTGDVSTAQALAKAIAKSILSSVIPSALVNRGLPWTINQVANVAPSSSAPLTANRVIDFTITTAQTVSRIVGHNVNQQVAILSAVGRTILGRIAASTQPAATVVRSTARTFAQAVATNLRVIRATGKLLISSVTPTFSLAAIKGIFVTVQPLVTGVATVSRQLAKKIENTIAIPVLAFKDGVIALIRRVTTGAVERIVAVAAAFRTIAVEALDRTVIAFTQDRTITAEPEDRDIDTGDRIE